MHATTDALGFGDQSELASCRFSTKHFLSFEHHVCQTYSSSRERGPQTYHESTTVVRFRHRHRILTESLLLSTQLTAWLGCLTDTYLDNVPRTVLNIRERVSYSFRHGSVARYLEIRVILARL